MHFYNRNKTWILHWFKPLTPFFAEKVQHPTSKHSAKLMFLLHHQNTRQIPCKKSKKGLLHTEHFYTKSIVHQLFGKNQQKYINNDNIHNTSMLTLL